MLVTDRTVGTRVDATLVLLVVHPARVPHSAYDVFIRSTYITPGLCLVRGLPAGG